MKEKIFAILGSYITIASVVAATGVSLLNYSDSTVHAEEFIVSDVESTSIMRDDQEKTFRTVQEVEPDLKDESKVNNQHVKINTYVEEGSSVTEYLDFNGDVLLVEMVNLQTEEKISVTNTGESVIVQTSNENETGDFTVETHTSPLVKGTEVVESKTTDAQYSPMFIHRDTSWTPWKYTNIAVPVSVFAHISDWALGTLTSFVAGIFSITIPGAAFILSLFNATVLKSGTRLAKAMDSSGNGWIGLYHRERWLLGVNRHQYKTK